MSKTALWVEDFMNAVYDGYGELALSSFNEETALKDATAKIRSLESRAKAMMRVVESLRHDRGIFTISGATSAALTALDEMEKV